MDKKKLKEFLEQTNRNIDALKSYLDGHAHNEKGYSYVEGVPEKSYFGSTHDNIYKNISEDLIFEIFSEEYEKDEMGGEEDKDD